MFNHHLSLALFDIRLKSNHKDLVLIKGNDSEVESVPLEGTVKLSLKEDIHVKKINLSLVGEFYYEYMDKATKESFLDRLCILKVDWNNLLTDDTGKVVFGNYGDTTVPMYKLKNIKPNGEYNSSGSVSASGTATPTRPQNIRTKSTPIFFKDKEQLPPSKILKIPKSGVDGTPFKDVQTSSTHSFLLPKGNYNLPFKVYLPTNVPETIEGLPLGTVLYKLQCNIERGRFEKSANLSKHIRIVRTLHPQNLNLCDSIDVNNTWVGKIQYNVHMGRKGVAIGSNIPISITLVPMVKGLKLKAIHGCLVEHYHSQIGQQRSPEFERLVGKQELEIPDTDKLPYEKWEFKTHYKVPEQLKKVTQSCEIRDGMIVVKHRLRIGIQLKNSGGHVSELRANLPVFVYISANSGKVVGRHYDVDNHHGTFQLDYQKEDLLFKKESHQTPNLTPADSESEDESDESETEDLDRDEAAPPLYEKHVFDKIFDMNLPQTPLEQFRSQQASPLHSNNNSSLDVSGYFDIPIAQALENNLKKKNRAQTPIFDLEYMSHIPSYTEALDGNDDDGVGDDFAPTYSDSGSENVSGTTTPIRIEIPSKNNNDKSYLKTKSNSLPHSKSLSTNKSSLDPKSSSPSVKSRFFLHKKKDK
ncbi:ART5 Arrestin-related trafficking adapter 5 [Candida maltosa Xu316]